mgnify:CR=1 FL=1
MTQDINVLALVKGTERYVFLYDDSSRAETLRVLGRFASNPELSFTWYDAAGNLVKSVSAGSDAFTKYAYDGLELGALTTQGLGVLRLAPHVRILELAHDLFQAFFLARIVKGTSSGHQPLRQDP